MKRCLKIVVSGDVDAGKSTLIGRFLYECGSLADGALGSIRESCLKKGYPFEWAYLLDSFEEERENQLTIDTTQVFCRDKKGREWVLIDVPGHKELVKNMLVGSSYADSAVLVVDPAGSLNEQSKRHLQLLKLLEINKLIVAVNKMDAFYYDREVFLNEKNKICAFLDRLDIKAGHCIPLSAKEGDNLIRSSQRMSWYKGRTLIEALAVSSRRKREDSFRFPIQDLYKFAGRDIAVGMILSGKVAAGEKLIVMPSGKERKVKQIKVFDRNARSAASPKNIGLILDGGGDLKRGMILCKPELPASGRRVLAKIFCLKAFNKKENMIFKSLSQAVPVRIRDVIAVWDSVDLKLKDGGEGLQELDLAEVELHTETAVVTEKFQGINSLGRFVLEDENKEICAAGVIL